MPLYINPENLQNFEKIAIYSGLRKTLLNTKALFSDETRNFRTPSEPAANEDVRISLRTAKNNVDRAAIHIIPYSQKTEPYGVPGEPSPYEMEKTKSEYYFDYYTYVLPGSEGKADYYFEVEKDGEIYFYNKQGVVRRIDPHYNFSVIFGFIAPDWAKGAVMYQIYVDRFCNGDETNDVVDNEYIYLGKPATKAKNWYAPPQIDDIRNFYGGDLAGIIQKLDYIADLGAEAIYLNPVFVSPSNHKYDIQDYDYIDPHIGVIVADGGEPLKFEKFRNSYATMYMQRTGDKRNLEASNALMARLIGLCHERGIKVILDGVFNHCGAFNKWLDREGFYANFGAFQAKLGIGGNDKTEPASYPPGAYKEKSSPYNNYFRWYEDKWPNNDAYDGWWGHDNHPKLNFEDSKALRDYIISVGVKWVSPPFNADGWRLDVAADLGRSVEFNHKFWREFRAAVKAANPNAIILGEHYGNPTDWLLGEEWDTIMNYDAFMEPLTWFLTGMEKHSEEYRGDLLNNGWVFESAMKYNMASLKIQSLSTSMNQLSNHDHSRFLTRTNKTVGRLHTKGGKAAEEGVNISVFFEAITFMFTWPGAPCVYYGDEAGLCGWTDPDNRRPFPWGEEDRNILEYHRAIIALRKRYPALRDGSVDYIYMDYAIMCYGRWDDADKFVVVINNDERDRQLVAPVWKIGVSMNTQMERLLHTNEKGFGTSGKTFPVKDGQLIITVPPYSSLVLRETN